MAVHFLRGLAMGFIGILSTAACSGQADVNANFPLRVRKVLELPTRYAPATVAWSADGSKLAAGDGGAFTVWDRSGRKLTEVGNLTSAVEPFGSIAFYDGNAQLIRSLTDGIRNDAAIALWDTRSGEMLGVVDGPLRNGSTEGNLLISFVSLPDTQLLAAVAAADGTSPTAPDNILIFSLRDWSIRRSYKVHNTVTSLAAFARDTKIVIGDLGGNVTVMEAKGVAPPSTFQVYGGSKYGTTELGAVAGSPDGKMILASAGGAFAMGLTAGTPEELVWERSVPAVKLFRTTDGRQLDSFRMAPSHITDAAWDPRGRFVAFMDSLGGIYLWEPMSKPTVYEIFNSTPGGSGLAISREGDRIAVATGSGVAVFSVEGKTGVAVFSVEGKTR